MRFNRQVRQGAKVRNGDKTCHSGLRDFLEMIVFGYGFGHGDRTGGRFGSARARRDWCGDRSSSSFGTGISESTYEKALCVELKVRAISFQQQVPVSLVYKGVTIGESRLDLLVQGKLIVEIKTVETLAPIHTAQAISYLKATGHRLALLINFNAQVHRDGVKRIIRS